MNWIWFEDRKPKENTNILIACYSLKMPDWEYYVVVTNSDWVKDRETPTLFPVAWMEAPKTPPVEEMKKRVERIIARESEVGEKTTV